MKAKRRPACGYPPCGELASWFVRFRAEGRAPSDPLAVCTPHKRCAVEVAIAFGLKVEAEPVSPELLS